MRDLDTRGGMSDDNAVEQFAIRFGKPHGR
jgi:hypothetical protein